MRSLRDLADDADQPAVSGNAELEAALNRGAAQIAAGEPVSLEPVLTRLRASANRLRRERTAGGQPPTSEV